VRCRGSQKRPKSANALWQRSPSYPACGGAVPVMDIGDHDPSGVHVFGSLDEDVGAFVAELGGGVEFDWCVAPA
jgi:hypothetical protein